MALPDKKSVYHSHLVAHGPLAATIKSEPMLGKDKVHYYVIVQVSGEAESRFITCENENCRQAFTGWNGRSVTITATGGRDDAEILLEESDQIPGAEAPAPRAAPAKPPPFGTNKPAWGAAPKGAASRTAPAPAHNAPAPLDPMAQLAKAQKAVGGFRVLQEMCQQAVTYNAHQWMDANAEHIASGKLSPLTTESIWAAASSLFIECRKAGVGDGLPDQLPQ